MTTAKTWSNANYRRNVVRRFADSNEIHLIINDKYGPRAVRSIQKLIREENLPIEAVLWRSRVHLIKKPKGATSNEV